MNDSFRRALGQYRTVEAYGAAAAEDRVQLITNLLQAASDRLAMARGHIERREVAAKGESISRAVAIIDGLRVSLDRERGGEIAANLDALYDYMVRQLTVANLKNDLRLVDEVMSLLGQIRDGWQEMSRHAARPAVAAVSATETA